MLEQLLNLGEMNMLLINVDMIIYMKYLGAPRALITMVQLMIGKFVMSKIPILIQHTPLIVQVRKSCL